MTENVLTKDFVKSIYETLESRKSISRLNFGLDDLTNVLTTIWVINDLELYSTQIDEGVAIEGYEIPAVFSGMVFPFISLTGSRTDERLVKFSIQEDLGGKVLTKLEMLDVAAGIYGSQRQGPVTKDISDTTKLGRSLSDYHEYLTSTEENVSSFFKVGNFPIHPVSHIFIKSIHSGMDVTNAIEEYLIGIAQFSTK